MPPERTAQADPVLSYPDPGLTGREKEVLLVWIRADNKAQVARTLFITGSTINTHLIRIRRKYACVGRAATTKAALVARALQDGLVELDDL
ncbi:LuxR C-terminal-related transcriptional regulator [Nocardia sp. NPDC057227]|uniref:LuxR C-terminal-related transcriptional regulator n=1 Tax=Nocardia sp. NPDC057227 TaxID=3346056 RepID=UPI00362C3CB8